MSCCTAGWNSGCPALYDSVERSVQSGEGVVRIDVGSTDSSVSFDHGRARREIIFRRIEIIWNTRARHIQPAVHGAKQTDPHAEVEGQPRSDAPVILKVRFEDLVPQIIFALATGLLKATQVARKKVREGV